MKKPATLATIAAVATLSVAASVPAHAAHEDIIVPLAVAGAIIYLSDDGHHKSRHDYRYDHRRHDDYRAKFVPPRHYGYLRREQVRHNRWHDRNDYRRGFAYYRAHEKYHRAEKYANRDYRRGDRHDKRH